MDQSRILSRLATKGVTMVGGPGFENYLVKLDNTGVLSFAMLPTTWSTLTLTGNLTVGGDLTVNGTTTTLNTTDLLVEDKTIMLASGAATGADSGILVERGSTGADGYILWNEATDRWQIGIVGTVGNVITTIHNDTIGALHTYSGSGKGLVIRNEAALNVGATGEDAAVSFITTTGNQVLDFQANAGSWTFNTLDGTVMIDGGSDEITASQLTIRNDGVITSETGSTLFISASTSGAVQINNVTTQPLGFYGATPIARPTGNALTALSSLGLVGTPTLAKADVGLSNVDNVQQQPLDATLTAIAGVTTAANKLIYATGSDTFTTTDLSVFARTFLDDADAPTVRTTLGIGATGKTIWVDSVNGNNSTAIAYRADRPFLTLAAAKSAAVSGDLIVVGPGTYNERNLLKNGVNWYFHPGATVSFTGASAGGIFDDSSTGANGQVICSITGFGSFTSNCSVAGAPTVWVSNASSNIRISAIDLLNDSPGASPNSAIVVGAGTLYVDAVRIYSLNNSTITQSDGIIDIKAKEIDADVENLTLGFLSTEGGTANITADVISGYLMLEGGSTMNVNIKCDQLLGEDYGQAASLVQTSNISIDARVITGQILYTSGNCKISRATITTTGSAVPVWLSGLSGTGLVLDGVKLIAPAGAATSITATSPRSLVAYNSYANKDVHANITISTVGGLTIDTNTI